eukprot:PLAT6229.1.p1 GENE.PLAT6229.1~~PLAT6229.1.p1  ORF type:complete len:164 (+),score=64.61 PLAT6229.1:142-633(+)
MKTLRLFTFALLLAAVVTSSPGADLEEVQDPFTGKLVKLAHKDAATVRRTMKEIAGLGAMAKLQGMQARISSDDLPPEASLPSVESQLDQKDDAAQETPALRGRRHAAGGGHPLAPPATHSDDAFTSLESTDIPRRSDGSLDTKGIKKMLMGIMSMLGKPKSG